jgi:hypothetical protein
VIEGLAGIVVGFLGYVLAELRRRQKQRKSLEDMKTSGYPPPPGDKDCKSCFFFREFKRRVRDDDTKRIKTGE